MKTIKPQTSKGPAAHRPRLVPLTGLAPLALWIACLLAVRNQRILAAFDARQAETAHRARLGLPPKSRKRRRQSLALLAAAPP